MIFTASDREANDVLVSQEWIGVTISDAGAVLAAGPGCTSIDPHTARCSDPLGGGVLPPVFELGDMNDRLRATRAPVGAAVVLTANGGLGDDILTAARGIPVGGLQPVRFDGGGGRDQLYGADSDDWFSDGDRDGAPSPLAPNADIIDGGGGGYDAITYRQRTRAVSVDLRTGRSAEGDVLRGLESIRGGAGDDRLDGTDARDYIDGGRGHDTISARGGDDGIGRSWGELGTGASGDRVRCGPGADGLLGVRATDYVEPACEGIAVRDPSFHWPGQPAYPTVRRRGLTYLLTCAGDSDEPAYRNLNCAGRISLRQPRTPHRLLASGAIPPADRDADRLDVDLRFTSLGRRLAARPRGTRATLRIEARDLPAIAWTILLRRPS